MWTRNFTAGAPTASTYYHHTNQERIGVVSFCNLLLRGLSAGVHALARFLNRSIATLQASRTVTKSVAMPLPTADATISTMVCSRMSGRAVGLSVYECVGGRTNDDLVQQ